MAKGRVEAVDVRSQRWWEDSITVSPCHSHPFHSCLDSSLPSFYLCGNFLNPYLPHPRNTQFSIVVLSLLPRLLGKKRETLKGWMHAEREGDMNVRLSSYLDNHDSGNFEPVLFQIRRLSHSLTNFDLCSVCLPQFGFLCWNVWFKCSAERLAWRLVHGKLGTGPPT